MKKTVIGLFASLALVLGMGSMGSSAVAAPYPSTVPTFTYITREASTTETKTFSTKVIVIAGNAVVDEGTVTIVFGGKFFRGPVSGGSATINVVAPRVNKDRNKLMRATYNPAGESVFKKSTTLKRILVKNNR